MKSSEQGYEMIIPCPICGNICYCKYDLNDNLWQVKCECGNATQKTKTKKESCKQWRDSNEAMDVADKTICGKKY